MFINYIVDFKKNAKWETCLESVRICRQVVAGVIQRGSTIQEQKNQWFEKISHLAQSNIQNYQRHFTIIL